MSIDIGKLSLDYMVSGVAPKRQESIGTQAMNDAVILYSQPILKALQAAPKRELRVYDLLNSVKAEKALPNSSFPGFEDFLGIIKYLAALQFITIVQIDDFGNHLVRLIRPA
jgi:hypothetical protein